MILSTKYPGGEKKSTRRREMGKSILICADASRYVVYRLWGVALLVGVCCFCVSGAWAADKI